MTTPKTPNELAAHIKSIVDDYVRDVERVALAAVGSAFSSPGHKASNAPRTKGPSTLPRKQGARRTPDELAAAANKLAEVIAKRPGDSMACFAEQLGVSARDLQQPMAMLKRDGRIRSVGARRQTRYFPTSRATA